MGKIPAGVMRVHESVYMAMSAERMTRSCRWKTWRHAEKGGREVEG